ncbi:MAG: restriction endonuclease [Caldimonas sp.]
MIAVGALIGIGPLFLHANVIASGIRPLVPFGWILMMLGGAIVGWQTWQQRLSGDSSISAPRTRREPTAGRLGTAYHPAAIELESMAARLRESVRRGAIDPLPDQMERLPIDTDEATDFAKARAPHVWDEQAFDVIEWRRFEAVVEALFSQAGFETRSQSHGPDGGIDIWLHSKNRGGAAVSVVQCKHWSNRPVGVDKVRELRDVMAAHDVSRGQFATTSTFTPEALAFARANGINPLDVKSLLAVIASRTPEQQQALLEIALKGEYWRPTCASCGTKMVERAPRNRGERFWGCAGYPRCKTRIQMRGSSLPAR